MKTTHDELKSKLMALRRAPHDATGFWEVTDVQPGRGLSSMTYAHHDVRAVRVYQQFYMPGPYDVIAFGVDSPEATPKSKYYVWTGLAFPQPDEYPVVSKWDDPQEWSDSKLRKVVKAAVGPIPAGATIDVYSPEGEGGIYLEFQDDGVEKALAFASKMANLTDQAVSTSSNEDVEGSVGNKPVRERQVG